RPWPRQRAARSRRPRRAKSLKRESSSEAEVSPHKGDSLQLTRFRLETGRDGTAQLEKLAAARRPGFPVVIKSPPRLHSQYARGRFATRDFALPQGSGTPKLSENNMPREGQEMADTEAKVVWLVGASGLAGTGALDALLDAPDVGRVFAV